MKRAAEMIYYTAIGIGGEIRFIGLASLYGLPDPTLLNSSEGTYWTAQHTHTLQFVDIKCIKQVVMMAPDPRYAEIYGHENGDDRWFMMQKPGVALLNKMGFEEEIDEEEDEGDDLV